MRRFTELCALIAMSVLLAACSGKPQGPNTGDGGTTGGGLSKGLKVLRIPLRSDGPKSLDPADGSTVYENRCVSKVYETLLQYKYLKRPLQLDPLLLEQMPKLADDGLTYQFKLKKGVYFQDDPCFPDGTGREMVASDVFYSWKRIADDDVSLKNWWVLENTIQGLDEYRAEQTASDTFDYDAPVSGFREINDHEFEVVLKEPVTRFVWSLAMFQTSVVPREAVEKYGSRFGRHPVGTGPYRMEKWEPGKDIAFTRNPTYHECYYPEEHMPDDVEAGFTEAIGTRLPIADRVEVTFFNEDQPKWLQFRAGNLDYTMVPAENYTEAFNKRTRKLRREFADKGIIGHNIPLLDFIFFGFNMDDPLLGGNSEKNKYLRQAISLALDWEERNDAFYNRKCVIYDGMIPPGLDGFPKDGNGPVSYRGLDLQRSRELLAKAGYPNGEGLPTIDYYTNRGANSPQQTEMATRQLKKVGININPRLEDFSTFMESVNNRKAPFFSFAWSSDYPDGENNLALFYGPNEAPGSNHFNYKNPEFDRLYEKIRVMRPSDERTKIYEQMRDMVIEDSPFIGSMARTRSYLVQPWLKNFKPTEDFWNWVKYLDVDESKRGKKR